MSEHKSSDASTTEGLPIAPSLGPTLEAQLAPRQSTQVRRRDVGISALALIIALVASLVAQVLTRLIALITNLAFYGRFSFAAVTPAGHHLGLWVVLVPVLGGVVVGIMARYGSQAIRGHGIPEAMEQILLNKSRIPPRLTFLKPLSAAISIGTGGPFGAEGPIIATGGALGSLVGQVLPVTADERKTLLAAGAAAGMAATFGSPVSAVLLAIELLLFEYRARSVIPVALACSAATAVRIAIVGPAPVFPMHDLLQPGGGALALYIVLGGAIGALSIGVTRAVYSVEEAFEKLPIHWMWWPAIGGLAVGVVGWFAPRTMGVGYDNIEQIVRGEIVGRAVVILCVLKFVSWAISLGSGTSGGTLAPLFTIGGGLGSALGAVAVLLAPRLGVDVRIAALVGMAAMFAGSARALLTSVVFAFETTRQPIGLLPLLGGCSAAFLVSALFMRHSIMTEKIARRGARVPADYHADLLDQLVAGECASKPVVSLSAADQLGEVRSWLESGSDGSTFTGFPVVDTEGYLMGVVTRRDLLGLSTPSSRPVREVIKRPPAVVHERDSLRAAVDHMISEGVGRLPVVSSLDPRKVVGMLTRSDLLSAQRIRVDDAHRKEAIFDLRAIRRPRVPRAGKS